MDVEVKIKKSEYEWLLDQANQLQLLEVAGVEGWHDYKSALREYHATKKRKEIIYNFIDELHQVVAEGNLTYPAGFGCGHQLDFDEDFVIKLVNDVIKDIKDLENE